jgi:hypothetical protein
VWLVDWQWPVQLAAVLLLSCHGAARRPRPPPSLISIGADAGCAVPDLAAGRLVLGPRTVLGPYWVRLDLRMGLERRDIVLCADQLAAEEWTRLRALLERTRHD